MIWNDILIQLYFRNRTSPKGQDLVLASRETRTTVQKKRLAISKSQENNLSSLLFGPKVAIRSKSMSVNKRGVDTLIADEGRTHFMVPTLLSQSRILPRDSRPTRGTKPWLSVVVSHLSCYRETWVHLIIMLYLVIRRYVAKGNKVILFKNLLAWLSILFFYVFFLFYFFIKPFKCVRTHICTLTPVNEYWADLPIVHISGWTGTATQGVNPICHYPVQAATLDQVSMLF